MDMLLKEDQESSLKVVTATSIKTSLDIAIRLQGGEESHLLGLFDFQKRSSRSEMSVFQLNAFNWGDHFKLIYNVDHPLTLLISDKALEMYNRMFFFIIRIRRTSDLLKSIWEYTNSSVLRRAPKEVYNRVRRI